MYYVAPDQLAAAAAEFLINPAPDPTRVSNTADPAQAAVAPAKGEG